MEFEIKNYRLTSPCFGVWIGIGWLSSKIPFVHFLRPPFHSKGPSLLKSLINSCQLLSCKINHQTKKSNIKIGNAGHEKKIEVKKYIFWVLVNATGDCTNKYMFFLEDLCFLERFCKILPKLKNKVP